MMNQTYDIQTERRSAPRSRVASVTGRIDTGAEARVVDLSLSGVRFESSSFLGHGEELEMRLRADGASARLRGRVVRCYLSHLAPKPDGGARTVYVVAVHFEQVSPGARVELSRILAIGARAWSAAASLGDHVPLPDVIACSAVRAA